MSILSKRKNGSRRPVTVSRRKLELEIRLDSGDPEMEDWLGQLEPERPRTRGQCRGGMRPCPFVSCRHHLYLDVNPENGSIKFNFPHLDPWELPDSCALDVAESGEHTLEEVGQVVNLTRERVRQTINDALDRARPIVPAYGIDGDPVES
jgi:hypothetical protein